MRSKLSSLAVIAASLLAASSADAKPRRVVVLDFEGPRQLADTGRSAVMSLLGDQYNIVATKNWNVARARASGYGQQQFRQASKQAGVDAIIEGWVQEEGRHLVLTVAVRDATTGNEVDHLSVRIRDTGVPPEASHKLASQLDDVMSWIDTSITDDPTPVIPDIKPPMLGGHDIERERDRARVEKEQAEDEADEADADDDHRGSSHRHRRHKPARERVDQDDANDADSTSADETSRAKRPAAESDDETTEAPPAPKKQVAAADDDGNELKLLFPKDSKEIDSIDPKAKHIPRPTPRFSINAGPYIASRGMDFSSDPEAETPPPSYPGSSMKGFAAQVEVYPFPEQKVDGRLSGLGFSFDIKRSVGATITAMDDTGYGDYAITNAAWATGIHYRKPIDIVSIDGYANFGSNSYTLGGDFPESVAIPDTSYAYLGGGLHIDLQVTDKASVGAGASYQYLLGAGMVTEEDWYGSGKGNGLAVDGDFEIPLPHDLYVKGGIEYRRVKIDFTGSGMLSQAFGAWDMTDSVVIGSGTLGVKF